MNTRDALFRGRRCIAEWLLLLGTLLGLGGYLGYL